MKKTGIYLIVNPSFKIYIGQSTNIDSRFYFYSKGNVKEQPALNNSFKKYGVSKHIFKIICLCGIERLNDLERLYIKLFQSNKSLFGLNCTSGGQDYFTHNEEVRKVMSLAQKGNQKAKGRKQSVQEILKRTSKTIGIKRTEEQRKKISDSLIGRKLSEEHRLKLSKRVKTLNCKKIIDSATNVIYNSGVEASKIFKIKRSTLIAMLNGQNPNKTTLKYL
jgi:group I intron endonuclease